METFFTVAFTILLMAGLITTIVVGLVLGVQWLARSVIHEAFCICFRCQREEIEKRIKARRTRSERDARVRMVDEVRAAVEEAERAARGHD